MPFHNIQNSEMSTTRKILPLAFISSDMMLLFTMTEKLTSRGGSDYLNPEAKNGGNLDST